MSESTTRRGRPKSAQPAMTNAERQRLYKQRLFEKFSELSLVTENQNNSVNELTIQAREIVSSLELDSMSKKDAVDMRCMLIMYILLDTFGEEAFFRGFSFALELKGEWKCH